MPILFGQPDSCKVLIPEISGSYLGDCKRGFAHGKGIAIGIDRYEGEFSRGLPNGKGTYSWANGFIFRGEWSKGVKEGKGELVYITARGDSVVTGIWQNDQYIGEKKIPSFNVIRKDNLLSCEFRRIDDGNEIIIKFMMKGQINSRIIGLMMNYSSGSYFKSGIYEGLQNVYFPLDLSIIYATINPVSMGAFEVIFECTITEPGKWMVILNN